MYLKNTPLISVHLSENLVPTVEKSYDALKDNSLNAQLARLVARDRLSFNQIANSDDIREGIMARLREAKISPTVPDSHSSIRDRVMKYAGKIQVKLKKVCILYTSC